MAVVTQIGALTDFAPNTTIQSSQVDANFAAIRNQFNALINSAGGMYIGDDANANVTLGITINQGAADDQIVALKSSDIAHALTSFAETDTYASFGKTNSAEGGLIVDSFAENAAVANVTLVRSFGGTADTTKSTAGRSLVEVYVSEHDGANARDNITNDGNVFGVRARVGAADVMRWLVDEDGDTWQAGGATFSALVTTTALTVTTGDLNVAAGAFYIATANGMDVNPTGDVDADLVTVGVTGAPKLWWDESEDRFALSKGLIIASLAGVGTRNVVVDANGVLSAP